MSTVELVVLLIPVAAAIQLLSTWLKVPSPTLLVLGGLALALMPGLPHFEITPNVVFVTFVPPLLYYGALNAPWQQFRLRAWPILSLSVFLVLVTMTVVAIVTRALSAEFTWAAAFTLGAIVAPPDPVAAVAVVRSLDVDRDIEGVLQGEGLANDATALVAYGVAVTAAMTGAFSPSAAAVRLVYAAAVGVAIGLAIGYGLCWLFRNVAKTSLSQNALSLVIPYAAYVTADRLGASGVLAVVAMGLALSRGVVTAFKAEVRIQFESLWTLLNFVLESLIFIFIGLELPVVVRGLDAHAVSRLIGMAAVISAVCIVVRLLWVFPSARVTRRAELRQPEMRATIWRQVTFVGWAGMRGADSLVIALALPMMTRFGTPFPARASIIVITFGVILATLVLQGFTMGAAAKWLRLTGASRRQEVLQEAKAWVATADAGLAGLEKVKGAPVCQTPDALRAIARLSAEYRELRLDWQRRAELGNSDPGERLDLERHLELSMINRQREALIGLRHDAEIDDAVSNHVQRYLDLETMLLNYPDLEVTDSPFDLDE
jgi:monovalent cation/hydrogen antiporter